jgi:hypothetical protein
MLVNLIGELQTDADGQRLEDTDCTDQLVYTLLLKKEEILTFIFSISLL